MPDGKQPRHFEIRAIAGHLGAVAPKRLWLRETLALVAAHVDEVQSAIGRTILLENPSTYVAFADSAIPETEFLDEIARRSGSHGSFRIRSYR